MHTHTQQRNKNETRWLKPSFDQVKRQNHGIYYNIVHGARLVHITVFFLLLLFASFCHRFRETKTDFRAFLFWKIKKENVNCRHRPSCTYTCYLLFLVLLVWLFEPHNYWGLSFKGIDLLIWLGGFLHSVWLLRTEIMTTL